MSDKPVKTIALTQWTSMQQAALYRLLENGRVIAYPTDTLYGLGIDVYNERAVAKLLQMKGRDSRKPVSVLYPSIAKLRRDFNALSRLQVRAIETLLPGRVTLLLPLPRQHRFPAAFSRDGFIGVRVVNLPPLNALLAEYQHPISSTSVNPAGAAPARSPEEIQRYFPKGIDLIIDHGQITRTIGSTIIKVYKQRWEMIRTGAVAPERVAQLLNE